MRWKIQLLLVSPFQGTLLEEKVKQALELVMQLGETPHQSLCKTCEGLEQQWELQMCWGYYSLGNLGRDTAWSTTATNQFTDPLRTGFGPTSSLRNKSMIILPWFCSKTEKQMCTYLKKAGVIFNITLWSMRGGKPAILLLVLLLLSLSLSFLPIKQITWSKWHFSIPVGQSCL